MGGRLRSPTRTIEFAISYVRASLLRLLLQFASFVVDLVETIHHQGMEQKEKKHYSTVGCLPTLVYCPDFITEAEQKQLLDNIYQAPVSKWKCMKNRRLQNWGGVVHEKGLISQDLPAWLAAITKRIYEESGIFPAAPNHVLINEYLPNQGIMPHQDGPAYFPAAAILSLGSPVVMDFTPHSTLEQLGNAPEHENLTNTEEDYSQSPSSFSVLLMPCSLLIFKDLAYSGYLHGIQDRELQSYGECVNLTEAMRVQLREQSWVSSNGEALCRATTRVSLTCRLVSKVCIKPDIAFAVGMIGTYQSNLGIEHWRAAKKVQGYFKGTRVICLLVSNKKIWK